VPEVFVIPIKSFRLGKQRLAGALDEDQRRDLGRRLAGHVASIVEAAGMLPLIVAGDDEVAEWALGAGFPILTDPGLGLDAAASAGVEWALQSSSTWVVLHADLPHLTRHDALALGLRVRDGTEVIAPSADGGTSAIGAQREVHFSYGPASFHRHLARLTEPLVVARGGLLLDIDSPNDLEALSASRRGAG
jgi:2-phospho-L-lactate guanylyltransferase